MTNELSNYDQARRWLAECVRVDEVKDIADKAAAIRAYAVQAGDLRLKADAERIQWRAKERLGELLDPNVEKRGGSKFRDGTLSDAGVSKKLSSDAQLVAGLESGLKDEALAGAEPDKAMRNLVAKTRREAKHKEIAEKGSARSIGDGRFALIYADPPWKFQTYSEKGLAESSPENHYPTMAIEDIAQLSIEGRQVAEIAAKDAGLFLWCTTSNLELALPILRSWGFTYRTLLVWDKVRTGTGYIWLNQCELLLYGKRGEFPMPAAKFSSVLTVERTAHSEKPAAARFMLESMYPAFDASNRLELFARGDVPGWTTWGNQA